MAERSIPPPTNEEFNIVFNGLLTQAKVHGADTAENRNFLVATAERIAQLEAEARWLRNMTHPT